MRPDLTERGSEHALRPWAVAAALYSALTVAVTFPLILHLNSRVVPDLGDPLLSTAILWWNAHVLPLTERWWNGFAFAPAQGMIAFSDHRLGLSLIATPLQWLGALPLTAYNITFLLTFPLCALGGHALGFTLTRRHDAAAICGLAFGFNPYRVAHLPHLELLAAFAMPVALAALHRFLGDRRTKWIVLFAVALFIQGLCSTYYLLFLFVLLGIWVAWFVRDWRTLGLIAAACASCVLALSPLLIGYERIHAFHGFIRTFDEVLANSADLVSFVTASPRVRLWGFTSALTGRGEGELFPGLTIIVLAALGFVFALRRVAPGRARWPRVSAGLLAAACVAAAVSISFDILGSWRIGPLLVTDARKPASIALLCGVAGLALRPAVYGAWRRRSLLAFYLVATAVLSLLSMGPEPTFLNEPVLYKPPYAWMMAVLPVFGQSVRAPARFGLLAAMALAAAAALAFDRLATRPRARRALALVALAGIAADGLMELPLLPPPAMWQLPTPVDFGNVVELPVATLPGDFPAMYRGTIHGHPVVNGQSGFIPLHYAVLQLALDDGNARGFDPFARPKPLLVAINRQADTGGRLTHIIEQAERVTPRGRDAQWTFYTIDPPPAQPAGGERLLPASASFNGRPINLQVLDDDRADTAWYTPRPQQLNDVVELDLGRTARLRALRLSVGTSFDTYPRDLDVTTSPDRGTWTRQFKGSPVGLLVQGAIDNPRELWMTVPLHDAEARFIRMRLDAPNKAPWLIVGLRVTGTSVP